MVRVAFRPLRLLHPRLEDVPVAVREFVAGTGVEVPEGAPVVRVEVLDDLERPAIADDVAPDEVAVEVVGERGVPGLPEEIDGVLQQAVGLAGQLVEPVQQPAGLLDGLEGFGEPRPSTVASSRSGRVRSFVTRPSCGSGGRGA